MASKIIALYIGAPVAVFDSVEDANAFMEKWVSKIPEHLREKYQLVEKTYYKKKVTPKARIEHLTSSYGNIEGDISIVQTEDNENIYYNDGFNRYCYIEKSQEGIDYRYIPPKKS